MEPQEYQEQIEASKYRKLYVSGEVILYSAHDLARMTGWSLGTIYRLFDDPEIPIIDYGRGKLVENHALMQFFSLRRDEVNRYSFQLSRNPWEDKIYSSIYSNLRADYLDRCKKVDDLQKFDPEEYINALFADFDLRSDEEIMVDEAINNMND